MANKLLDLTLFYKGKRLNFAQEGREIKSKFEIGSNINLFWEILNTKFPDKFEFVSKKGNGYVLNLHSSMTCEIEENGSPLSDDELKQKKILSGKSIVLNEKLSGKISFLEDYEISFRYVKPYIRILSREDKALIKKFDRRQKPREGALFELFFVFGGLTLFMGVLLYMVGQYEPPVEENLLAQKIARAKQAVQEIKLEQKDDKPDDKPKDEPKQRDNVVKKPVSKKALTEAVEQAERETEQELQAIVGDLDLGDLGDIGDVDLAATDDVGAEILEANVASEIVVAGGRGGAKRKVNAAAVADFDVDAGGGADALLGDADGLDGIVGGADLEGLGDLGLGELDMSEFGDVDAIETKKVGGSVEFKKIEAKYAALAMVSEEDIDLIEMTDEQKSQMSSIKQQVGTYRSRLVSLYNQESLIVDMGGYLNISLVIASNGSVEAVDIERASGANFTDDFISKCRKLIMKWKFGVKKPAKYRFRQKLQNG
jgi:outer membrane biosynthesis protein TonB